MPDRSDNGEAKRSAVQASPSRADGASTLDPHVPADLRDVSFRASVRGYERHEVDRYVQRVNRVIAELEIARSPEAAVRHALDRVGEQTSRILQQARETADAIIDTARAEAEEAVARATKESYETVERARAQAEATLADAGKEAQERVEQGERELATARKQAEQEQMDADAAIAAARSRADEIVGKAQRQVTAIDEERQRVVKEARELAARLEAIVGSEAPTRSHRARGAPSEVGGADARGHGPRSGASGRGD